LLAAAILEGTGFYADKSVPPHHAKIGHAGDPGASATQGG